MFAIGIVLLVAGGALCALGWLAGAAGRDGTATMARGAGLALTGAVVALISLFVTPAAAQPRVCAPTPALEAMVASRGQVEIGAGIVGERLVIRLFAAPGGETFTVLTSSAEGVSCVQAMGVGLDVVPPPAGGRES